MSAIANTPNTPSLSAVLIGKLSRVSTRSKADDFMRVLDWAIRCGIPFHEALQTLSSRKISFTSLSVVLMHNPNDWDESINLAVLDIMRGERLSVAMRRLERFLPDHLIAATAAAEDAGNLAAFIQTTARNIRLATLSAKELKSAFTYAVMQFAQIIVMFIFLNLLIVPKFTRIYAEMYEGAELPGITKAVFNVQNTLIQPFAGYAIFAGIVAVASILLFNFSNSFKNAVETCVLKTPWIGSLYADLSLMECAEMFACSLALGDDIVKAAEFAANTTKRVWIRKPLRKFAAEIAEGAKWPDAWERTRLGSPYHAWILRNAAAMENPLRGFAELASILKNEVTRGAALLVKTAELAALIFNAILTGFIVLGLGIGIFSIIYLLV